MKKREDIENRLKRFRDSQKQLFECSECAAKYEKKSFHVDGLEFCQLRCLQKYITKKNVPTPSANEPNSESEATPEKKVVRRRTAAPLLSEVPRSEFLRTLSWRLKVGVCTCLLLLSWYTGWLLQCVIVLMIYGMYEFTDVRERQPGELSAYSVFNPNCEAITGTFKAEDIDKQYRRGGLGIM